MFTIARLGEGMFTIKDNILSINNMFKDSDFKFESTIDLNIFDPVRRQIISQSDLTIKTIIEEAKRQCNFGAHTINSYTNSFYTIFKEASPEHVLALEYNSYLLNVLVCTLEVIRNNTDKELASFKNDLCSYIQLGHTNYGALALIKIQEKEYRKCMLDEVIHQLIMLIDDKADHVLLVENGPTVSLLTKLYTDILFKDNKQPKDKFIKWQYKSLAIKKRIKNNTAILNSYFEYIQNVYDNRAYDYRSGCIKISKNEWIGVDEKAPNEVNLKTLYPSLRKEINTLKAYSKSNFRTGLDFNNTYLNEAWRIFNDIKCMLMFIGYSEAKAVNFLNRICFSTSEKEYDLATKTIKSIKKINPIVQCDITKQLMPAIFIVPVKPAGETTILNANIYYLNSCNLGVSRQYGGDRVTRYKMSSNEQHFYEATKLNGDEKYTSTMRQHNKSALEYLVPKYAKGENVKSFSTNKGYRPTPYLGIELETERNPNCECPDDVTEKVLDSLGRDFVILKYDGTLTGRMPFEIVTAPATLAFHKERWLPFMNNKELKNNLQSFTSGACGMHVHISRDSFTGLHLAKFMRFINWSQNSTFINKIAQRAGNTYSVYRPNTSLTTLATKHLNRDCGDAGNHYMAVNTSNIATVEVRIFRGNLGKVQFFKNMEFVHAVWTYTLTCSLADLEYKKFLHWLFDNRNNHHKLYANLQKWLIAEGFNVSNIHVPKGTSEEVKPRLIHKRKEIHKIQQAIKRKFKKPRDKVPDTFYESREEILKSA